MGNSHENSRSTMLAEQVLSRGIDSPRVLAALARVPRERFVSPQLADSAYDDRALPIDCEQTISQPYIVALMTDALELTGSERVLEIGTGCGYQTAVLAELAREVITVERFAELSEQARQRLAELGYDHVQFVVGDGTLGWPAGAPYDRILVAAAAEACPPALWEQLAEGGLLVLPLGSPGEQRLQVLHKRSGVAYCRELCGCRFVPLVPGMPPADGTA